MTLQEQFYKAINYFYVNSNRPEMCEKIAEDFAIGFNEWISENMYENYWSIEKFKDDLTDNEETIHKTWISLNDASEVGDEKAICYSIKDLMILYKFQNNL